MNKKRIFIDTDIFLDSILERAPYNIFSNEIINLCEYNKISGYTSTLVLANLYYIIKKISNHTKALQSISKIRAIINILPFTDKEIGESLNSNFKDFKDGSQHFIALNHKLDFLITRNIKDFKKSAVPVLSPQDYLRITTK